MTCIVAMVDSLGYFWMGADRVGTKGDTKFTHAAPKILQVETREGGNPKYKLLLGYAGNTSLANVLRHRWKAPPDETPDPQEYITAFLAPSLKSFLKATGLTYEKDGQTLMPGLFLVGYQQTLAEISDDGAVVFTSSSYWAIGAGMHVALGALHALSVQGMRVKHKLEAALEASAHFETSVGPPFDIIRGGSP